MNDEQKRIAIAEADGWRIFPDGERGEPPGLKTFMGDGITIPDYLNDRNAIVGAILRRFTTDREKSIFCGALAVVLHGLGGNFRDGISGADLFDFATATAAQLADAYLAAK